MTKKTVKFIKVEITEREVRSIGENRYARKHITSLLLTTGVLILASLFAFVSSNPAILVLLCNIIVLSSIAIYATSIYYCLKAGKEFLAQQLEGGDNQQKKD